MSIFAKITNWMRSIFNHDSELVVETEVVDEASAEVDTPVEAPFEETVEEEPINEAEHVATDVETVETGEPNYTDIFGNPLAMGDDVVPVLWKDGQRRGYTTVLKNYNVLKYDARLKNVIKLTELEKILDDPNRVKAGRKHGYLHILEA